MVRGRLREGVRDPCTPSGRHLRCSWVPGSPLSRRPGMTGDMRFTKILIANRGEIACRIARTARDLGLRTVAVFSDADADAPHVGTADEAVRIGPAPARDSYLNVDAILVAAKRSGADAVHPGYGFLSENAAFAKACEDAGLVFVGPTPAAIEAMGNKAKAKRSMTAAGIACVPGYEGDQADAILAVEARRIGFPLMIKAATGGGGRGMRLVRGPGELTDRRRPPHRDPNIRRRARQRHPSGRARLLDSAAAPKGDRGGAIARRLPGAAGQDGRSRNRRRAGDPVPRCGNRRVPARRLRKLLFSRNEYPAAGRASGDGGDHRARSRRLAIARGRGRGAATAARGSLRRPRDRGAALCRRSL